MKIHTHQLNDPAGSRSEEHAAGGSLIVDRSAHAIEKKLTSILPLIGDELDFMLEPTGITMKHVTEEYLKALSNEKLYELAEIIFPLAALIHDQNGDNLSRSMRELEAGLPKIAFILSPGDDINKTEYILNFSDSSKPRFQRKHGKDDQVPDIA